MCVRTENRVQLVLEAAGLDRAVDPALLRCVRLPPPAAGAIGFSRLDGARARSAADRRVALVVQRVVRHDVRAHVVPDFVLRPLGERIELDDRAVVVVDLDLADVRARRPLVAAQSGDPRVESVQHLRQRLHLADVAAEQAILDGVLEEVEPAPRDHPLDVHRLGLDEIEVESGVVRTELRDQVVRLLRQAAGVDGEDGDRRIDPVRHVDDRDAVDLERGRDADARAEALDRPLEDLVRLRAFELDRQLAGLQLVNELERAHATTSSTSRRDRAGSSPARKPSSSSESRRWNSVNASPSRRPSSQPRPSPSTASSSPSLGTRRKSGRAICGSGASEPRTKMSYAESRRPSSSLPVVPWKPRSPTQCCAHACGQPSRCSRRSAICSPNDDSRCSTSRPRRCFVSPTEKLQCGSPVQPIEFAHTSFVSRGKPISPSRATTSSTRSLGTPVTTKFCWRVIRTSPPNDSTRSATAISCSPETSPSFTGTPTYEKPSCFCACTPMWFEGRASAAGSA